MKRLLQLMSNSREAAASELPKVFTFDSAYNCTMNPSGLWWILFSRASSIAVECRELDLDGENHIRVGKMNLVDLATREPWRRGHQDQPGMLGNIISAPVDGKGTHIPY